MISYQSLLLSTIVLNDNNFVWFKAELDKELDKISMSTALEIFVKFFVTHADGIIHIFILLKMLKCQFHKNHDQPQLYDVKVGP